MRVVTLCGSLHSGSTNAVVLATVADHLAADGVTVEAVDTSIDVPAFRPEAVDDPPDPVARIRELFRGADGVVIAVPEYAGGMPGWVKNITDWMVGAAALHDRPVVVLSASTGGGANAIEQMTRTLIWQGSYVVATCGIAAPLTMVRGGSLTDPDAVARLHAAGDVLLGVMRGERTASDATAAALAPFPLDLTDRLR